MSNRPGIVALRKHQPNSPSNRAKDKPAIDRAIKARREMWEKETKEADGDKADR